MPFSRTGRATIPSHRVKNPSDAEAVRIHVLTADEEKKYFTFTENSDWGKKAARHRDLFDLGRLMLDQGMRPEEAVTLRSSDVDLECGQLQIRWGKSAAARRRLDLAPKSREILARRMAAPAVPAESWIFPASRKSGEHVARLNNAHKQCAGKRGWLSCSTIFATPLPRAWRKPASTWPR